MIPYREQEYLWVEHIVKKECVIPTGLNFAPPPECDRPLNSLLEGLQKLTQGNFLPAVFVLGIIGHTFVHNVYIVFAVYYNSILFA